MFNLLLTQAQRKVVADLLPKLGDRLKLDEKNSHTISFTAKELESIRQKAEAALICYVTHHLATYVVTEHNSAMSRKLSSRFAKSNDKTQLSRP